MTHAGTVTLLFTDLVGSTALLQRAGDEQAQRIFQAHHRLLKDAVAANGGHEVKWLGDGLMVAFPSAADAVRCAVAMQQAARRPVAGERLSIRVGLNVGDALREETDYFGTPVVVARRLCDRAAGGQILCSALVAGLLAGRQAFAFRDCGQLELKGIAAAVPTCEVQYRQDEPKALLTRTPFVGRATELAALNQKLQDIRMGHGGLLMLVGEPGIGKTRTLEEFAERARNEGTLLLWGRCYDGEWAPPYGPFVEAIAEYGRGAELEELRRNLGPGAAPVARLVPALREYLPDVPEPAALQPDEERFRLLDAISQFLIALSARAPVVLVLDDLHWADKGTIAMLRHVARFAPRHRVLLLGAYRDVDLDRQHPLADALGALHRETSYERILLRGLVPQEVEQLLETIADQDVPDVLVRAITAETDGNPFFIREVLLHLVEEGKVFRQDERWISSLSIQEMGIPEGVRQVIGQRLSRLSADANRLLAVAAAFDGTFRFDIASRVAGLDEVRALDAVDGALQAQLLRPGSDPETYDFTHALIRHTLYAELSPSRQVRLHRQIAGAMEQVYGDRVAEHAAEVAYQYSRSATLPGAERGVPHALAAADRAEAASAHDEVVTFLRIAVGLLPQSDARRSRLLGRMGMVLTWTLNFDEALQATREAGDLIAVSEGEDAAASYLAEAAMGMRGAGFEGGAWALAAHGLVYVRDRRDITWVQLKLNDILRREAEDPNSLGIVVDTPERRELADVIERLAFPRSERAFLGGTGFHRAKSRADALARFGDDAGFLMIDAGEYHRSLSLWEARLVRSQQEGRIANSVGCWGQIARCHTALGDLAASRTAYTSAHTLAARLTGPSVQTMILAAARLEMRMAMDEDWEDGVQEAEPLIQRPASSARLSAALRATVARLYARLGRAEEALLLLGTLLAPLERAPSWAPSYTWIVCDAAATLWLLGRTEHIEVIERNLREKVVVPDFRYPMRDGRLSVAHLCALQGRYEEASEWFARARTVLDEQGARPLRAIADFDEALMYQRRGTSGDRERAVPLLEGALRQFEAIGMSGWIRRAEDLKQQLAR